MSVSVVEFDFMYPPFLIYSALLPFKKPQVVLKIENLKIPVKLLRLKALIFGI
jgi:hypothetical protein